MLKAVIRQACYALLFIGIIPTTVAAASGLTGIIESGGSRIVNAEVTLFRAGRSRDEQAAVLGSATSSIDGEFSINYAPPRPNDVIYLVALHGVPIAGGRQSKSLTSSSYIALAAVLGKGHAPAIVVHVNELTTAATAYAMSAFISGKNIAGSSPGLQNAAATAANLVDVTTGAIAAVLGTRPNGRATATLSEFNSLANLLAACVQASSAKPCLLLTQLAWAGRGQLPSDTFAAIHGIARNPWNNVQPLFELSRSNNTYRPALERRQQPNAWTLAIKYIGNGHEFDGPGNMAFDKDGNIWSTNNYVYGRDPTKTVCGGKQVLKLTPTGADAPGAPFGGGGVDGAGFGIAIDQRGRVWVANFGFKGRGCEDPPAANSVSLFSSSGEALSPATGFTQGGISSPQGTVVDQKGNVWIANAGKDSKGLYTITEYRNGDPSRARRCWNSLINQPFDLAIDAAGNVWATNSGNDTVVQLAPDCSLKAAFGLPGSQSAGMFKRPLGLAVDSRGNIWVANSKGASVTRINPDGKANQFFGGGLNAPWGLAVDGDDHIFIANFGGGQNVTEFCGVKSEDCPLGIGSGDPISPPTGYTSDAFTRLTGVRIDQSGNVWLADNWELKPLQTNPGGHALVEFIGLAAPIRTPLIGPPEQP
jgi:hypothetical protein